MKLQCRNMHDTVRHSSVHPRTHQDQTPITCYYYWMTVYPNYLVRGRNTISDLNVTLVPAGTV